MKDLLMGNIDWYGKCVPSMQPSISRRHFFYLICRSLCFQPCCLPHLCPSLLSSVLACYSALLSLCHCSPGPLSLTLCHVPVISFLLPCILFCDTCVCFPRRLSTTERPSCTGCPSCPTRHPSCTCRPSYRSPCPASSTGTAFWHRGMVTNRSVLNNMLASPLTCLA